MTAVTLPYHQRVARATDATAKTSDTTQAADDVLSLPVEAGVTYEIRALLYFTAAATPGIEFGLSVPEGSTGGFRDRGALGTPIAVDGELDAGDGTNQAVEIVGHVTAAIDGEIAITWAQQTSNAGETKVLANSALELYSR